MANRKGVFIGAYVPAELKRALQQRATSEHRTLSQEITRILEEAVKGPRLPPNFVERRAPVRQLTTLLANSRHVPESAHRSLPGLGVGHAGALQLLHAHREVERQLLVQLTLTGGQVVVCPADDSGENSGRSLTPIGTRPLISQDLDRVVLAVILVRSRLPASAS